MDIDPLRGHYAREIAKEAAAAEPAAAPAPAPARDDAKQADTELAAALAKSRKAASGDAG